MLAVRQVRAEKPKWYLSVIAGAVLRTLGHVAVRSAEYLGYLQKGQLPPARISLTSFTEEVVLDGVLSVTLAFRACCSA
jgi:acetyl-CoA carboxylase/biotin carboxylase 1